MLKLRGFRQLAPNFVQKSLNFRTKAVLRNETDVKTDNETLCSGISLDLVNPNSPVPFREVNKSNLMNYRFPILQFSYDQNDVVEHAKSVGVQYGEKYSESYLDRWNPKLQVLPSFIFPFTNKILIDMSLSSRSDWLIFEKTVHGEHYVQQIRHMPPKGTIDLEIKTLDILDKGKGTLYCFSMNGYNTNGEIYFKTEYQMFEIGTGEFNGNKCNPHLTQVAKVDENSEPNAVVQFPMMIPDGGYKKQMSDFDLTEIGIYSSHHPRQHYSEQYDFMPHPLAHGRYTFAGAMKRILFKYGHGDVEKFKAAKVRFAEPVYLGETIQISTWKKDSRITFQGNVQRNGKTAKALAGGYVDLEF